MIAWAISVVGKNGKHRHFQHRREVVSDCVIPIFFRSKSEANREAALYDLLDVRVVKIQVSWRLWTTTASPAKTQQMKRWARRQRRSG